MWVSSCVGANAAKLRRRGEATRHDHGTGRRGEARRHGHGRGAPRTGGMLLWRMPLCRIHSGVGWHELTVGGLGIKWVRLRYVDGHGDGCAIGGCSPKNSCSYGVVLVLWRDVGHPRGRDQPGCDAWDYPCETVSSLQLEKGALPHCLSLQDLHHDASMRSLYGRWALPRLPPHCTSILR